MILRQILSAYEPERGWAVVNLACGHRVGPIGTRYVPKKRKRCLECERIADHRIRFPSEHQRLINGLQRVPMDDRAETMVEWVSHLDRARPLRQRGLDSDQAVALTEQPTNYPLWRLCFEDDDEETQYG
jgi:hypothetical protein